jgi:hypothetical protein
MPEAPTISQIDHALRAFVRSAPRTWGARVPRQVPLPGPPPQIPPGELDVEAIGRAAAHLPAGDSADRFIEEQLRAAGVPGDWSSSREYRELWYLCVLGREAALEQNR